MSPNPVDPERRSTIGVGIVSRLLIVALALLVAALLGELLVRAAGYRPWTPPWVQFEVAPGGRLYDPDDALGYVNRPGRFVVQMEWGHSFVADIDERRRRRTAAQVPPFPPSTPRGAETPDRPTLWFLGGSFTYGWLVEGNEAFPGLVQRALPDVRVVNFGTPGYGTLQSLLQFEAALEAGETPDVVVLAYASFHDLRNTGVRRLRKTRVLRETAGEILLPRARIDDGGALHIDHVALDYRPFPLMRLSALSHFLEQLLNQLEIRRSNEVEVSRAIIARLAAHCEAVGARLVIVALTPHPDTVAMLDYWAAQGMPVADMSVDGTDPAYTFLPDDNHPSPLAHQHYADVVVSLLARERLVRVEVPGLVVQ